MFGLIWAFWVSRTIISAKSLSIPHKKNDKQPLTEPQKHQSQQQASERIRVEHVLGGMTRYRILSDRLRIHDVGLYNVIILGVCAGL